MAGKKNLQASSKKKAPPSSQKAGTKKRKASSVSDNASSDSSIPKKRKSLSNQSKAPETTEKNKRKTSARITKKTAGKTAPKKTSAETSETKKKASTKRRNSSGLGNASVRLVSVPARQASRWRPVRQGTVNTVSQLLDTSVNNILTMCSVRSYEEIQGSLAAFKLRFMRRLRNLSVPVPTVNNYSTLQNTVAGLERDLMDGQDHIHRINDEMDRIDILLEEGEEQKERMQKNLDIARAKLTQQSQNEDLSSDVLNLPRLPSLTSRKTTDFISLQRAANTDGANLSDCLSKVAGTRHRMLEKS